MAYQSTSHFTATNHVTGISGRYLFAGIVSLATGVGAGAAALTRGNTRAVADGTREEPSPRRSPARWMPLVFLVTALAMQAYAVQLVGRRFWQQPDGGITRAWDAMAAWSPWSPTALAAGAWLTTAAAAAALAICLTHALRRPAPPPDLLPRGLRRRRWQTE
jgi:small subunit ribosomal protein S36